MNNQYSSKFFISVSDAQTNKGLASNTLDFSCIKHLIKNMMCKDHIYCFEDTLNFLISCSNRSSLL